jgi:hypothetical protein
MDTRNVDAADDVGRTPPNHAVANHATGEPEAIDAERHEAVGTVAARRGAVAR